MSRPSHCPTTQSATCSECTGGMELVPVGLEEGGVAGAPLPLWSPPKGRRKCLSATRVYVWEVVVQLGSSLHCRGM